MKKLEHLLHRLDHLLHSLLIAFSILAAGSMIAGAIYDYNYNPYKRWFWVFIVLDLITLVISVGLALIFSDDNN